MNGQSYVATELVNSSTLGLYFGQKCFHTFMLHNLTPIMIVGFLS